MSENNKLVLLAALCLVLASIFLFRGCNRYGSVGEGAYEHAKALYSICNRRDSSRLETFAASLENAKAAGDVTEKEFAWLDEIVAEARAGNWDEATKLSRQLMEDQVEGGP